MASPQKVKQVLLSLAVLPNAPDIQIGGDQIIRSYHEVLSQWDDEILELAALSYKSTETFFPSPGALNNKVLDMQMLAVGMPTALEAWNQVLGAVHHTESVLCEQGAALRNSLDGLTAGEYLSVSMNYSVHFHRCGICKSAGTSEAYDHPAVAETVRLLGGRDALFTDNLAADRKQFVDAYRERVAIEGRKLILPERVNKFLSSGQAIHRLAEGMRK